MTASELRALLASLSDSELRGAITIAETILRDRGPSRQPDAKVFGRVAVAAVAGPVPLRASRKVRRLIDVIRAHQDSDAPAGPVEKSPE